MRTDQTRPFTVIDAMILIAALAVGMGAGVACDRFDSVRMYERFGKFLEEEPKLELPEPTLPVLGLRLRSRKPLLGYLRLLFSLPLQPRPWP